MNRHRMQFVILLALLAALFLNVSSVGAAPKDGPIVSISSTQSEYTAAQDVLITVTYSNPTKHSVRILNWFTPKNGLEEPVFVAKVNGGAVSYTGAIYKRPSATGNDYITLMSGKSVTYNVNMGQYYDLSTTGQYEVYYDAESYNLYNEKGNNASNPDSLTSDLISFKVEGRTSLGKSTPIPPPPPGGNSFSSCTTTQQSILISARAQAKIYAAGATSYFPVDPVTTRYTTWFGVNSTSRYSTVTSHFTSISNSWNTAGVSFDCGCKQNYYAYVYPNKPYNFYLCKVFWTAPLVGTDSQGGTLIHEMSHFYGTNDYVYGQTGAKSLAISNPDNAVMNADNHEYFAENNPTLP